jgi:NADH-quinone oxidoreductase subunit J
MMDAHAGRLRWAFVLVLAGVLLAQVGFVAGGPSWNGGPAPVNTALQTRNTEYIGGLLFSEYLLPFEIASVILTVALIGVVVLVKHEKSKS